MEYPYVHNFNVKNIYGEQPVQITIYSGLTVFVGPNASGKTQTLKALRTSLKKVFGSEKVRYLSSNRIGTMETYRSRVMLGSLCKERKRLIIFSLDSHAPMSLVSTSKKNQTSSVTSA